MIVNNLEKMSVISTSNVLEHSGYGKSKSQISTYMEYEVKAQEPTNPSPQEKSLIRSAQDVQPEIQQRMGLDAFNAQDLKSTSEVNITLEQRNNAKCSLLIQPEKNQQLTASRRLVDSEDYLNTIFGTELVVAVRKA